MGGVHPGLYIEVDCSMHTHTDSSRGSCEGWGWGCLLAQTGLYQITSIQRFLGHKKLSSTLIYAKAHDQTVADDYFQAMQRVEQRLEILPSKESIENVKVQVSANIVQLIERLELPELCYEERLYITFQLRELFGTVQEAESVMVFV